MIILLISSLLSFAYAQQLPLPEGHYSKGKLLFAWELPAEGEGYMRLFLHRNRGWGTDAMIEVIERTGLEMSQLFPMRDRLQVGDISGKNGGKISRHNSHQNGLDVDLAYYRINGIEQLPEQQSGFQENMIKNGKLSKNFDIWRNWELLKALHRFGKVQRIFVDRVIKREFCRHAFKLGEYEAYAEVLRSLRPFPNHSNHLHVRLECPEFAEGCVKQDPPPEGTGC